MLSSPVNLGGFIPKTSSTKKVIESPNEPINKINNDDKSNNFIIEQNNNKYEIDLNLINNCLNFKLKNCQKENKYDFFSNSFNLEDLKKVNKLFNMCDSINDALNYMEGIIEQKKVEINLINEKKINIILKVKFIKEEEIILNLIKKEEPQQDLLNEINLIKEENHNLKERIEKLEKYFSDLDKLKSSKGEKNYNDLLDEMIVFPSKIIKEEEEKLLILRKFDGRNKKVQAIDLLFRASRDGDKLENIKKAVNLKKNILAILITAKGRKFAGFTEKGYDFSKGLGDDEKSFLISFDNYRAYDYEKYELDYQIGNIYIKRNRNNYSAIHNSSCCPFFFQNNANINIPNNFFSKNCKIEKVEYSKWNQILELNANEEIFNIKELEYFHVHFNE